MNRENTYALYKKERPAVALNVPDGMVVSELDDRLNVLSFDRPTNVADDMLAMDVDDIVLTELVWAPSYKATHSDFRFVVTVKKED